MNENSSTSSIRPDTEGRASAFIDLAIILAVLVGVKQAVLPYSLVFGGPASTFSAMAVGTFLLWRRGFGWSDLGLRWPKSWWVAIGISVAIFLAFLATAGASSALADLWFEDVGTSGRFDFVNGNLAAYLLIMALVWTHGSFFEELLFRAFIITKLGDGLGGTRAASLIAVVLAAIFFGYRHYYYQGMHGALVTGCIGLLFGLIYLRLRSTSILPLILVHGAANSIAQTSRFLSAPAG
ncbi:CPBP family intramembrane glutamic endopeptidase [uncultured Erythrobacter sp.]|uniref:CPBP family intramembrane glutamic endopeptidase n=1 Tax=uncultured Erythrobacter sp. TaxID=263913 RepID=UPI002629B435|nr:CPBP family intramembrane glutamic endopeptidase [uncultured Erythrobacter sp.]